ncbi:arginase family protein [Roseovarius sp. 2305UL8-3]|uniref:arginase family protein n=1 Tax=Roseovarius conchicola TaxID=3121636 RepID=UPI003529A75A
MQQKNIRVIGAPVETGAGRRGCVMGPSALRCAGLIEMPGELGYNAEDAGNTKPAEIGTLEDPFGVKNLTETVAWTVALEQASYRALNEDAFPIFAGGDHSVSMGSVAGATRYAAEQGKPFYMLWLDAHPDFHRLNTTSSGNLHGSPVAYVTGQESFSGNFPDLSAPVQLENICMMGIRSVDPAEHHFLVKQGVEVNDMRRLDETGVAKPLRAFLNRVQENDGFGV